MDVEVVEVGIVDELAAADVESVVVGADVADESAFGTLVDAAAFTSAELVAAGRVVEVLLPAGSVGWVVDGVACRLWAVAARSAPATGTAGRSVTSTPTRLTAARVIDAVPSVAKIHRATTPKRFHMS